MVFDWCRLAAWRSILVPLSIVMRVVLSRRPDSTRQAAAQRAAGERGPPDQRHVEVAIEYDGVRLDSFLAAAPRSLQLPLRG